MASLGSVTSLGVGSGFELQQMLEDFRKIDEQPIENMKNEIAVIEDRLTKYDEVEAKLIAVKSHALTLSLGSNFLERTVTSSDEEIASATVLSGAAVTSNTIEVLRMATKSSWQTAGVANVDTSTYIPTSQVSTTGFSNADSSAVVDEEEVMSITYGSGDSVRTISMILPQGSTLNDIVDAINADSVNQDGTGGTYVTASSFQGEDGLFYLRIASTTEGSVESNRVMVTVQPENFQFKAPAVEFSYTLGDGEAVAVSVEADTTFNELADLINSDAKNAGITAKVINDGSKENPYRLVLTANQTGEDNRITISGMQMIEVQGAEGSSLNAEISVDGIIYGRGTNTEISDIIQGVKLTLKGEGEVSITTSADDELVRTEIVELIKAYNDAIQEIRNHSRYDAETEEWGILATSYSIKGLPIELNGIISTVVQTNTEIKSLFNLGVSINRDGTITIDEEILDTAIAQNREGLAALFVTDEETGRLGLGDILNEKLRNLTNSTGMIRTETDFSTNEKARLETDIEEATARLDKRYDLLARQFVALDMYIGQMNAQANYLTSIFSSYDSSNDKS
ncbi:MAG: flagellar filament capping protein FliD [Pseudomonadota bacterium]